MAREQLGSSPSDNADAVTKTFLENGASTLANKTLTTPVISSISNTGTLTLPTSTDTLVGRATTDTLTNKTISLSNNTVTGIPADFMLVQVGNVARAVGMGDFTVGHRVGRAFTATSIIYQFETADASGSTTVELRRNGTQVTSSNLSVTAANQADGTGTDSARTATINQSFSAGDRINLQITAVGTTPGKGLKAWIVGTWN